MADTPAELGEHEAEGATYPPLHAQVTEHNGDEDDDEDDDDEDDDVGNYDEDDDEALPEYDITLNGLSSYLHALELGIDLPTIDLTNQGIGDHGIIELLDKLQVRPAPRLASHARTHAATTCYGCCFFC